MCLIDGTICVTMLSIQKMKAGEDNRHGIITRMA